MLWVIILYTVVFVCFLPGDVEVIEIEFRLRRGLLIELLVVGYVVI